MQVVKALLAAIAVLEDLARPDPGSRLPLNALEEVAYHLGEMGPDERRAFLDGVEELAADEELHGQPDHAAWIRGVPVALGVADE